MRIILAVVVAFLVSGILGTVRADEAERIAKPAVPFAVKVTGKGKPIIFIPGLACSGEVWDSAVDHYKDHNECHVLTLAGFAGQPVLKDKATYLDTIRKGIIAYIKEKKLDKPVVVGHSLGGYLVFALAVGDPNVIGPVIAVDGMPCMMAAFTGKAEPAMMKSQAEAMEKQMAAVPHEQFLKSQKERFGTWFTDKDKLEKVHSWITASDQATVARAVGDMVMADARPGLEKVKAPVLLIGAYSGDLEKIVKRDEYDKRMTDQIAKAPHHKLVVTTDAKHFIMYDQPKWLWEQMDAFLKEASK
jgi:pimeloyl-ACP methyl ester carboxylesterase